MGFVSTTAQNHKRLSISFPSLQLFYWYVCASAKHNWNRVCIHFQLFLLVFFLRLDYLNRKSIMMIVRNSFAMINLLSFAQYRVIVEWNWNLIPKCAIDFQHTMSTRNVRILVRGRETKWENSKQKKTSFGAFLPYHVKWFFSFGCQKKNVWYNRCHRYLVYNLKIFSIWADLTDKGYSIVSAVTLHSHDWQKKEITVFV